MQSSECDMDLRVRIKEEERDLSPDAFVKFSIENILRPDFGRAPALQGRCKPEAALTAIGHPGALSHPFHQYHNSRLKLSPYLSANAPFLSSTLCQQQQRCRSGACRSPSPPLAYQPCNWSRPAGKGRPTCPSSARPEERREREMDGKTEKGRNESGGNKDKGQSPSAANQDQGQDWPAWVFCTRYSDRPSSGPRARRCKRRERKAEEKRPRTAFTQEQLERLKREFQENRYLNEKRRQDLAKCLQLNESQIKIWNKRAKLKKASGARNPLQLSLLAQGLYNHHNPLLGAGQGAPPAGLGADGQPDAVQPGSRSSGTPSRSTSPIDIGTCTDSNASYCKSDRDFDIH